MLQKIATRELPFIKLTKLHFLRKKYLMSMTCEFGDGFRSPPPKFYVKEPTEAIVISKTLFKLQFFTLKSDMFMGLVMVKAFDENSE